MLTAVPMGMLKHNYQVLAEGHPIAVWDSARSKGGTFTVDGSAYQVRAGDGGTTFQLLDPNGEQVAQVEGAGRLTWTLQAEGHAYEFRRPSAWTGEHDLVVDGRVAGFVRRSAALQGTIEADLPGLNLPTQIFLIGVQIAIWHTRHYSAT